MKHRIASNDCCAVQSFVRTLIHNVILFINTSINFRSLANWAAIFGDNCQYLEVQILQLANIMHISSYAFNLSVKTFVKRSDHGVDWLATIGLPVSDIMI